MKKLSVVAVLLLSGCAVTQPHFNVSVNALSSKDPAVDRPASYLLAPGQTGVAAGDLQFQEFSGYIERALAPKGLVRTTDPAKAELVIVMSYGIGDPQTFTQQVSVPVWGQTGISSLSTNGQVVGNTYRSTTTVNPTYGITGYAQSTSSETIFVRNLKLTTYKKQDVASGTFNQLWTVSIASAGSKSDLRLVFPYLVAAGAPYIGKNPGHIVNVTLDANDKNAAALLAH